MKIKFKPTNLGRARPKSKSQESPVSEKLQDDEKTEENTCNGGYGQTEVGENAPHSSTSSSSLPTSNLLTSDHVTITAPPSITDNATPISVPSTTPTVMPTTSLPTTPSCKSSVTYDSTTVEATFHDELPRPSSEMDTSTSVEATHPAATSEPLDAPDELATLTSSKSPQYPTTIGISVCPNGSDHQPCNGSSKEDGPLNNVLDSQDGPEAMEDSNSLSAPLTLDVSLPLEIFATSLSGERNEANHENGSKEKEVEDAGKTNKGPKAKEKKIAGVKCPRREATKSKPEGAARSNGKAQPSKPRASKAM